MSNSEAQALQNGHTDIFYGTSPKWNYWLDYPSNALAGVWLVHGAEDELVSTYAAADSYGDVPNGLRPVIEIPITDIG